MTRGSYRVNAPRTLLIVSTLLGSWLGMQAVHELGHAVGAWATGGRVARVVLDPLTISRTDLAENPHPGIVAWAGPLVGVAAPLLLWLLARVARLPGSYVLRFFAGFCWIANGAYLAFGAIQGVGDAGDLLRHGSPACLLWLFGGVAVPAGLGLWHRQSRHFGLGPEPDVVSPRVAWTVALACALLLMLGLVLNGY